MTTFTVKKYRSLILSCLLHALMMLALIFMKVHHSSPEHLFPTTKSPAQVHMQSIPLKPMPQAPLTQALTAPVALPSQTLPLDETPPFALPVQDEPSKMHDENPPFENAPPLEPQTASSSQALPPGEYYSGESEAISSTERGMPHPYAPQSNTGNSSGNILTREAFMDAFSSAIRAERRRSQSGGSRASTASTSTNRGPAHVEERLKEWTQHHYKDRIYGALRRASNITATRMHHEKSLEKVVHITIPINKDGSVGTLYPHYLSGIPEVDNHIIKVFKAADFPPIPDRYNTNTFLFTMAVRVSLKEGSGVYHLFV